MPQAQGQKFIRRNRAPRVQIEYDLEIGNATKKIELPFVMGVLAGLSGKPVEPLPDVAERKFLEIDVDNFRERMKAIKPRVAFYVPNRITGEENLPVELTFESLDDFLPDAVARRIEPLRNLLEARERLANLLKFMDGKADAEKEIGKLLKDRTLQEALATKTGPLAGEESAESEPNTTAS